MKKYLVILLALSSLLLIGCDKNGTDSVREIVVSGTEFSFTPDVIELEEFEKVNITFKNDGEMPHSFFIKRFAIGTEVLEPGEEETIEFEAPEKGEYKVICTVAGHEQEGMEGMIIVK